MMNKFDGDISRRRDLLQKIKECSSVLDRQDNPRPESLMEKHMSRASAKDLQILMDTLPFPIWLKDKKGVTIKANGLASEISEFDIAMSNNEIETITKPNGDTHILKLAKVPYSSRDGKVKGTLVLATDITDAVEVGIRRRNGR
jgi:PAS domain-containing protein